MRWKLPKIGDKRLMEGFLFSKLQIGNETRWLERAYWEEECREIEAGKALWIKTRWLTFTEFYAIKHDIKSLLMRR